MITQQQLDAAEARLEELHKKREEQYIEVMTFRQSLAIADSMLASLDGQIVLAKAEKLRMERELLTKPNPNAGVVQAFPKGRWKTPDYKGADQKLRERRIIESKEGR